jgi:chromate transporter
MNTVLLYLLLLKGTVTAFAGLASLPVLQDSWVTHYHVLTNDQLNDAVVITLACTDAPCAGTGRSLDRP